ncbi:phosphatase PAP2 family protein [Flavobacterium ponti]|uniref:Phosphatase PAP2 family protein n=1 Tax=Flavobacterium ponti TaxID=665133 RepID=A0ABV9P2Q5_9FLAO
MFNLNVYRTKYTPMHKSYIALILFIFTSFNCEAQQSTAIEKGGDLLLYALPMSAIATTIIKKDPKGSKQFALGFLVNGVTTEGLKYLVKKERPNGTNFKSFPSGHTSITFQSAAFLQKRYGWKFGIPAYVLASYTGFSRIESKNHYFIDVLAGAAIGIGSSYIFTTKYTKDIQVSIQRDDLGTTIGLKLEF